MSNEDTGSVASLVEAVAREIEQEVRDQLPIESPQMKHRREAWLARARYYQRENGAEE